MEGPWNKFKENLDLAIPFSVIAMNYTSLRVLVSALRTPILCCALPARARACCLRRGCSLET